MPWDRMGADEAVLPGLSDSEHLLVWTWRKIAIGHGDCALIEAEFVRHCGTGAPPILSGLDAFVKIVAASSRRRLRIGLPGEAGVTGDERLC